MADSILSFTEEPKDAGRKAPHRTLTPTLATSHPYNTPTVPRDILQYLPPNGNPFSLYGDPYAQLVYILLDHNAIRRSRYWFQQREEDNSYTTTEINLLSFLSKHRCATSSQIHRAIFKGETNKVKIREFIRRCVQNGILVPFSWQSPCENQKKRPRVYGMSPVACQAAEQLLNLRGNLPRSFKFVPIDYANNQNPLMGDIFNTLIANELYCNLHELDRVIDWSVNERILLPTSDEFRAQFIVKLIKDVQDFKTFWIEVIRPRKNWFSQTINRFQALQKAYSALAPENRPERVIVIADDDSRFEDITMLAQEFMPDVIYRLTTDERLLNGWTDSSLVQYSIKDKMAIPSTIPFLKPDHPGMTASQYAESFKLLTDDYYDDDDDEY